MAVSNKKTVTCGIEHHTIKAVATDTPV